MNFAGLPDFLGKPLGVTLIDLLLAGDNAVVIALVCLTLPPRGLRWVLALGTVGAVALRVTLVTAVGGMLVLPGLKLVGGALLSLLAVNLVGGARAITAGPPPHAGRGGVIGAAFIVMLVDVLMSLDNVMAVAAVAGDSPLYLSLGLVVSVAILMFASAFVARLLLRQPELARLGAALLGWVAAGMMTSDTIVAGWIGVQSPALPAVLPILAAIYVYMLGGGTVQPAPGAAAVRARAPPRPTRVAPRAVRTPPAPPPAAETAPAIGREIWVFGAMFVFTGVVVLVIVLLGGGVSG